MQDLQQLHGHEFQYHVYMLYLKIFSETESLISMEKVCQI